jgi:hypothetical protein
VEIAFRKKRKKALKNYQPLFYILFIRGQGNQSLFWHEKKKGVVFFLACSLTI